MANALGGGGKSYIFQMSKDKKTIVKADGTTAATAASDAIITLGGATDIMEQTDYTTADDGSVTIKLTTLKADKTLNDFLKVACPRTSAAATTGAPEVYSEDGSFKVGGTTGGSESTPYLIISYGTTGSTDVPVAITLGYFSMTSGSFTWKYNEWVKPTLELKSTAADGDLIITSTLFDTAIVTAPTADSIKLLDKYQSTVEYITKKA